MSALLQKHLQESVLRTALSHLLKHKNSSPERTARNILELMERFRAAYGVCPYSLPELVSMIQTLSPEECIGMILGRTY